MVTGILADANVEGQLQLLLGILEQEGWADVWHAMALEIKSLGL